MKRRQITIAALAVILVGVFLVAAVGHQRVEVTAATTDHSAKAPANAQTTTHESSGGSGSGSTAQQTTTRSTPTPRPTTVSGAS